MGIGAAVIGASVIGAGASLATGAMNSSAANNATNAQVSENNKSLALQQQEYNTALANLSPYSQAGQSALTQYQNLIGGNGTTAQTTAINALQSNPLYTAETGVGNQAILANASATGGLRSGNANYNLAQFNANTLANVYQQQVGNLGSLASLGENAAAGVGNIGQNYANSATAINSSSGSAQAGGILSSAGALGGGINSGLSSLLNGLSTANSYGMFSGGSSGFGSAVGGASGSAASDLAGLF